MDTISLSGIAAVGHHGVFDFERRSGQPFLVDVELYTDFTAAAETDDLTLTAHYGEVAERIKAMVTGEPLNLIETLAVRIAKDLLENYSVDGVSVTVHKPKAPIEVPFGDVAVSVNRTRADFGLEPVAKNVKDSK
ncbi:dihydroneopterin aldolase [Pseudarthrobacter sp. J1738]|uniref:dihydroneopterin aldolase n=1 Tax=Pseudarthrobacter sp. J1738 TaxID=3420446 RepID=UPI003D2E1742